MSSCPQRECPFLGRSVVRFEGELREADIFLVGESPSLNPQGKERLLIDTLLEGLGYTRSSIYYANACRCAIDKKKDKAGDINKAAKFCKPYLDAALARVKPQVIITLGGLPLRVLTGKQKIMENRGRFFDVELQLPDPKPARKILTETSLKTKEGPKHTCKVFATVHPSYALYKCTVDYPRKPLEHMTGQEKIIFNDFLSLKAYIDNGMSEVSVDTSKYVKGTAKDMDDMSKAKVVALDYETDRLNMRQDGSRVLSVSLSEKPGHSKVFLFNDKGELKGRQTGKFKKLLANPKVQKVVAFRSFEEQVSKVKLDTPMAGAVHDVLLMAHLVDENYFSYSLENVANIHTSMRNIKDVAEGQRSSLAEADEALLVRYNGVDTDATLRAYNALKSKIEADPKLARYYVKFILPVTDLLAGVQHNGCMINTDVLKTNQQSLNRLINRLHKEMVALLPASIKEKYAGDLRLSRPAIPKDFLFKHRDGLRLKPDPQYLTEKTKEPQLSEDHLQMFQHLFIDKYIRWKKALKVMTGYIDPLWQYIEEDSRVYPITILTRTVTGRSVMKDPPIQTVPQRGEFSPMIKACYEADAGWVFGARDLAQSELRIAGWIAQDKNILKALDQGIDLHTFTAAVVNSIPIEQVTKEMRQSAKAVNFGFIYGQSAQGFRRYAFTEYGVEFSEDEAEAVRQAFFARPSGYYSLLDYHNAQRAMVHTNGYVVSPLGRVRRLPDGQSRDKWARLQAERQAINFPVQSFSSDLGLLGMMLFNQEVQGNRLFSSSVRPMWFIHDNVIFQAKEDKMDKAMGLLKECMEVRTAEYIKKNFNLIVGYPIESDGKIGRSWETMKEAKDA